MIFYRLYSKKGSSITFLLELEPFLGKGEVRSPKKRYLSKPSNLVVKGFTHEVYNQTVLQLLTRSLSLKTRIENSWCVRLFYLFPINDVLKSLESYSITRDTDTSSLYVMCLKGFT